MAKAILPVKIKIQLSRNRHDLGHACSVFSSSSTCMQPIIFCRRLQFPLSDIDTVPLLFSYLPSVVKCFTVFIGSFNSVLKNSGYILMSSLSETHTRCSLLSSSAKLSLIGTKVSGTFI